MKRLLLIFFCLFIFSNSFSQQQKKYEYTYLICRFNIDSYKTDIKGISLYNKEIKLDDESLSNLINSLNKLGKKGWKVVEVIPITGNLSDSKIGTNEPITQRIFFLLERESKEENISKIDYKKLEEASNRAAFRLSSKF